MKLLILTGMSGAGKSTAFKMLEDMGYYCVDNLPIQLLKSVVELAENGAFDEKIVVGIDVRNGRAMKLLPDILQEWEGPSDLTGISTLPRCAARRTCTGQEGILLRAILLSTISVCSISISSTSISNILLNRTLPCRRIIFQSALGKRQRRDKRNQYKNKAQAAQTKLFFHNIFQTEHNYKIFCVKIQ